ncbi:hypothetical protein GCM10027415_30510 [Humibacter ginsengisoli]
MAEEHEAWGRIPVPVAQLAQILAKKASKDAGRLTRAEWPTEPQDVQDLLRRTISDAHKVAQAGTDLRALLSAYAHRFHKPRPLLADLARAQHTSPQGFTRRYSDGTVVAIAQLSSQTPDLRAIRDAFPSVSLDDLATIDGPVGASAKQQRKFSAEPHA